VGADCSKRKTKKKTDFSEGKAKRSPLLMKAGRAKREKNEKTRRKGK